MKGHVRLRGSRWYAVLDLADPATGKRRRKWHRLEAKGKRSAETETAALITKLDGGTYIEPSKTTLADYFEHWLAHKKASVSPRTYERYEEILRKNVNPLLGRVILSRLQTPQLTQAYSEAITSGRRKGAGGLSPQTVHHMHRIIKQALKQAVSWGLLVRSPADAIEKKDRPKVEKRSVSTIDAEATMAVIEAARELRLLLPLLLGSMTGMRRGEIAALRWKSVDLDRAQVAVIASVEQTKAGCREKETKGSKARTIALPSVVVEELRSWRARQAEEFLRLGFRPDGETFVVTQADGAGLQPNSITHAVSAFLRDQGARVTLHGLRHSHASHLLNENVHPKIVQERLGHSSIAITMDIYSHLMPNMQADAAAKVDAALRGATGKKNTR